MEFLTPRGLEQIGYWSVSLGPECYRNAGDSQRTRMELERRFALDEQTAQLKETSGAKSKVNAECDLSKSAPQKVSNSQSKSQTLHTDPLQLLSVDETQAAFLGNP